METFISRQIICTDPSKSQSSADGRYQYINLTSQHVFTVSREKTREAQQRMDEMRQLISRRQVDGPTTPHNRPRSFIGELNGSEMVNLTVLGRIEESLADADQSMVRAVSHHETLRNDLEQFILEIKEVRFCGLLDYCGPIPFPKRKLPTSIEREWNYRTPSASVSL